MICVTKGDSGQMGVFWGVDRGYFRGTSHWRRTPL